MIYLPRYLNFDREFICKHIGHRELEFTDSGYAICARCGAHSYYDYHKYTWGWYSWSLRLYWRLCALKYHMHPRQFRQWLRYWFQKSDEIPF